MWQVACGGGGNTTILTTSLTTRHDPRDQRPETETERDEGEGEMEMEMERRRERGDMAMVHGHGITWAMTWGDVEAAVFLERNQKAKGPISHMEMIGKGKGPGCWLLSSATKLSFSFF
jgi:hypothetical protein